MTDREQALDIEITGDQQAGAPPPRKKREKKAPRQGWSAAAVATCTELLLLKAMLGWSWAQIARAITNNVRDDERLRRFGEGTQLPERALMKRIRQFLAARDRGAELRAVLASLGAQEAAFVRAGHNAQRIPSALPLCGRYKALKTDKVDESEVTVEIELELTGYTDGAVTAFECETRDGQTIRGWGYGSVSPEGRLHLTMQNARRFSHEYQHALDIDALCNGTAVQQLTLRRPSFGVELSGDPRKDMRAERRHLHKIRWTFVRQVSPDELQ